MIKRAFPIPKNTGPNHCQDMCPRVLIAWEALIQEQTFPAYLAL